MHWLRRFRTHGVLATALLVGCGGSDRTEVSVEVVVPAEVPTIENGVLRMTLWSYDPGIADLGATPLDVAERAFSHSEGETDVQTMSVAGSVPMGHEHYISVEGFAVIDRVEQSVLWDGIEGLAIPTRVVMQYIAPGP